CDIANSGLPCTSVPWDSCEHIEMLVNRLLVPYVNQVHNKFPGWSMDQALQGAVAGYNGGGQQSELMGGRRCRNYRPTDYSNDVHRQGQMAHGPTDGTRPS
ncbi:glycine, glutamate and proline-rich protein-like, partial [Physella acuta]|uniref:glycine, glutamate and proline-rich protein-like n=1 Tax=Physella acuta TaxID=109671 RepID=UPI0027DC3ECB